MFDYRKFRLPDAEYISASALVPYENNAKLHPDEQITQIANSIREFGMRDPIGVWENENGELVIVEGHGRLLACEKLGLKEVPIIRHSDLTDAQRRAYTLAHNQTTMNSGFDADILATELEDLEADFDMSEFGFDLDGMHEPFELDAAADETEGFRITIKFKDYAEYKMNEAHIREMAEEWGGELVIGK